jgi:hypothetical protein
MTESGHSFLEPSRMVNWRQDPCDRTTDKYINKVNFKPNIIGVDVFKETMLLETKEVLQK